MELIKRFRVIYDSENRVTINPFIEYKDGTITYVGNGQNGAEFNSSEEAKAFIKEKGLVYEYPTED